MQYTLGDFNIENNTFWLQFKSINEEEMFTNKLDINFPFDWEHQYEYSSFHRLGNDKLLEGIQLIDDGKTVTSEFKPEYQANLYKQILRVYTIMIPTKETRELLHEIITLWSKFKRCPIEVRSLEHMQYPLTEIIFNHLVISPDAINKLVNVVLRAIVEGDRTVIKDEVVVDETAEEELSDEIVEYENDDIDVNKLMTSDEDDDDELPFSVGEIVEGEQ